MAILPLTLGAAILGLTLVGCALFPHHLPRNLLYEIAVLDLIVRAKLSRMFPSLNQPWWHQIIPGLYLGGIPLADQNHLEEIKSLGIRSVLAILEDDEAEVVTFFSTPLRETDWQLAGIDYRRLSCPDMHAMSLDDLAEASAWLHEKLLAKEPIYVHCKAGRGRSAMIVIGYLMRYGQMTLEESIDFVASKRSVIRFRPCQLERLEEFSR